MVSRRNVLAGLAAFPCYHTPLHAETLLGGISGAPAPDDWNALVVGIDDYDHARPLNAAVSDARAVSQRLQLAGYTVDSLENPSLSELEAAISVVTGKIRRESNFLLYFAGHGFQVGGVNFLMARDSRSGGGSDMVDSSVNFLEQLNRFAARQPRQCLVLLDACRNEPFGVSLPEVSANMASVMAPVGFSILYSAGSGQYALDGLGAADPDPNGVFVRALLDQMRPGIPLRELMYNTRRKVTELAASVGHSQHPAIYDQSTGDYSLGEAPKVSAPPSPAPRQAIARPADPSTAYMIIGQDYIDMRPLVSLPNVRNDCDLLSDLFSRSGMRGITSFNDRHFQILDQASRIAQSDASTIVLYWAGYGGMRVDGEHLYVADWSGKFQLLEVAQLLSLLAREGRRVVCFLDTMFFPAAGLRRGSPEAPAALWESLPQDLVGETGEPLTDTSLAIVSGAELYGRAWDGVNGEKHSPFTLAIANSIGRDDLDIAAMARTIAQEVLEATGSISTPQRTDFWSNFDASGSSLWTKMEP